MADNFSNSNTLYPNPKEIFLHGASVYFPGTSLVALLFKNITFKYLIFCMQFFAISIVIFFYFIQKYILHDLNIKIENTTYFYLATFFYFILNYEWLVYACELKPDTTAFVFGSLGMIISKVNSNEKIKIKSIKYFLGIILTGSAILFKQQYIFFLFGLNLYALLFGSKSLKLFSIISLLLSLFFIFIFYQNTNIWFWTVKVLSDDGLLSLKQILIDHRLISIYYIFFFILLFILEKLKFIQLNFSEFILKLKFLIKNSPWPLIITFVFLGSVVSAIKVGGNAGNTAYGLVVLMPLFFIFLSQLNKKVAFLLFAYILIFKVPSVLKTQIFKYNEVVELNNFVSSNIKEQNLNILTGSNVYIIARNIKNINNISNYWMYGIRDNVDIEKEISMLTNHLKFDYLIIENFDSNKNFIKNSDHYHLIFENKTALIAKRR
jgi:hypothetical protein